MKILLSEEMQRNLSAAPKPVVENVLKTLEELEKLRNLESPHRRNRFVKVNNSSSPIYYIPIEEKYRLFFSITKDVEGITNFVALTLVSKDEIYKARDAELDIG